MGLMQTIANDILAITTNTNEFALPVVLTSPDDLETASISGIHSDHSTFLDESGNAYVGKLVAVAISELAIINSNPDYPIRVNGLIALRDHKVTLTHADGAVVTYKVRENRPDYTINLIDLLLSEYAAD